MYDGYTCEQCQNLKALPLGSQILLGTMEAGQCRGGPPQTVMIFNPVSGQFETISAYPIIPKNNPACALFVSVPSGEPT